LAQIDLCLFAGRELEDVEAVGIALLQASDEPLDRVVAVGELVVLDQILEDALGVAPQWNLLLDPRPMTFASGDGRARARRGLASGSRWPGWGFSTARGAEPVATLGELLPGCSGGWSCGRRRSAARSPDD